MADTDVVRTVFQTEWLGGNALSRMIRQYGMADKAMSALGKKQASGGVAMAVQSAKVAELANIHKMLAKDVLDGSASLEKAEAQAVKYAEGLGLATSAGGSFLSGLSPMVVGLGAVAAAVIGAAMAFKQLYPVMEQGAEIGQLDSSFNHLINTMTDYPDVLDDMRKASQFTVSTMAAQEGIMTLVAGSSREMTEALTGAAPKLLEISKAANKLNPSLGDTNFMFTSLAKGVKRAEPRLIDNLGLKLRVSDANRQLAEELNKSVMALTAEEKQLAILNETLRAGDALIDQVGGSVDGLVDPFQRATAAGQNFGTSFKQLMFLMFGPQQGGLLDAYSMRLRSLAGSQEYQATIIKAQREGVLSMTEANDMLSRSLDGDTQEMKANIILIAERTKAIEEERLATAALIAEFERTDNRTILSPQGPQPFEEQKKETIAGPEGFKSMGEAMQAGLDTIKQSNAQFRLEMQETKRIAEMDYLREWGEGFTAAADAREKALKADMDIIQKWGDTIEQESRDTHEAWEQYTADIGNIAEKHLEAEAGASFFSTAIGDIGEGFRVVGGATKEQTEELERLTKKLESAKTKLGDLEMGLGTFGRKEEAIAKSHGKLIDDISILENAISGLGTTQEGTVAVHQEALWNWENITKAIGESAKAADLAAQDYLRYKLAVGETTMEQAQATIQATALQHAIEDAMSQVKIGELEPEDVQGYLRDIQAQIDATDFTVLLTPSYDADAAFEAMTAMEREIELRHREDDKLQFVPEIDESTAEQQLLEHFFGPEALEPAIIQVEAFTDDATTAIRVWKDGIEADPLVMNIVMGEAESFVAQNAKVSDLFPGHAYGGSLRGGHSVLVGEQGPEIIQPPGNAEVIPSNQIGGAAPQINLSIHVGGSIGTDDFVTIVEDKLLEAMQQYGL